MTASELALELVRLDTINPPGREAAVADLLAAKIDAAAEAFTAAARAWCGV